MVRINLKAKEKDSKKIPICCSVCHIDKKITYGRFRRIDKNKFRCLSCVAKQNPLKYKFKKGHTSWLKGTKGLVKPNKGQIKKGSIPWNKGKNWSREVIEKLKISHLGKPHILSSEGKKSFNEKMKGEKSPCWKGGISRDTHSLARPEYKEWRTKVFTRDNFKCRIANENCKGQLQAHHILRWADFPELRYEVNNGIALCVAHHPRARAEEKRLIPTFKELISMSVSKEQHSFI
jgi:hypothetical protein